MNNKNLGAERRTRKRGTLVQIQLDFEGGKE
jgi:hypothetical protein